MGHTIIEKIIGKNIGREVKPGDIVTVNVDRYMTTLFQQVRLMIQDISVLVMNLWKNTE